MPWFMVDDHLHDHRKVRRLGPDRLPAMGLWTLCGSWAKDNKTDGYLPAEIVRRYDPTETYAARLVDAGLWISMDDDGEPGYRYHDWADIQWLNSDYEDRRAKRVAAGRLGGLASGRSRREASALSNHEASALASGDEANREANEANAKPKPRPKPTSSSSSPTSTASLILGLGADDDEMTKIIELIKQRHNPTAIGPYIRQLAANGDLTSLLTEVRQPPPDATNENGYKGPTHEFVDEGIEVCGQCQLPESNARHAPPSALA